MKTLKRLKPCFEPWDTPLYIGLQLDLCHVSPLSGPGHSPEVIACTHSPYINCLSLKVLTGAKSFAEVYENNEKGLHTA